MIIAPSRHLPISAITLHGDRVAKQSARERMADSYDITARLAERADLMALLEETPLRVLDRKVKHGHHLSFEEAFCGMCYAIAATNLHFFGAVAPLLRHSANGSPFDRDQALTTGTAFLQLMAAKESFLHLTAEEVAGIAAACSLDTVIRLDLPEVIETSGMGGDRGFYVNGQRQKTINVSTLSAFVLRAVGLPVAKHGSYSNTSAVGSTEAIELLGSSTTFTSQEAIMDTWRETGFCYLDAHLVKTIHDLSHLLMMETINHVAGPMSSPFSPTTEIYKVMGVNEKVDPQTIAEAYAILHRRGFLRMGGVAAVCGLDQEGGDIDPSDLTAVRRHTVIDELSPYASVVSFAVGERLVPNCLLKPSDFGIDLVPETIYVSNTVKSIQEANRQAITGEHESLGMYLAMNAALGLFIRYHGEETIDRGKPDKKNLESCYTHCLAVIKNGEALRALDTYVNATNKSC